MKKKLPFGLDLPGLMEWGYRIILAFLVVASFYLNTVYARKDDLGAAVDSITKLEAKYSELPREIAEQRRELTAHEQSDADANKTLAQIKEEMSAVRATQRESMKNIDANFNRVFNKLDQLPSK